MDTPLSSKKLKSKQRQSRGSSLVGARPLVLLPGSNPSPQLAPHSGNNKRWVSLLKPPLQRPGIETALSPEVCSGEERSEDCHSFKKGIRKEVLTPEGSGLWGQTSRERSGPQQCKDCGASGNWVLLIIESWYRIQLDSHPPRFKAVLSPIVRLEQAQVLEHEIQSLLVKEAIEHIPPPER